MKETFELWGHLNSGDELKVTVDTGTDTTTYVKGDFITFIDHPTIIKENINYKYNDLITAMSCATFYSLKNNQKPYLTKIEFKIG